VALQAYFLFDLAANRRQCHLTVINGSRSVVASTTEAKHLSFGVKCNLSLEIAARTPQIDMTGDTEPMA